MDNKYACNTYIETDRIIYVSQKQGDPVGVQSILQSSASEVPTMGLLSCMGWLEDTWPGKNLHV